MNLKKKIFIIIPCRNEEKGIGKVITTIPTKVLKKMGYNTGIIVIDNNSTDKTAMIATKHGAHVVFEKNKGKGNALKAGFSVLKNNYDYVIIIDGDNSYKSYEIPRLIEPLENNFADVIIGSRLGGRMERHSITFENRIANWFFTFLFRHFYKVNTTDVLSGFIAFKKKVIDDLMTHIESRGFTIEMELNGKASKLGYKIFSVPITYAIRDGNSKIEKINDTIKIFYVFIKYLFWKPLKN